MALHVMQGCFVSKKLFLWRKEAFFDEARM